MLSTGTPFPTPDPGWPTNPTINAAFTIGAAIPLIVGLVLAARIYRAEGSPVGFICIVGGAVASLVEPLVTYVGFVHYPPQQQWTVFSGFGESIPLFLTLAYAAEIGLGSFTVWRLLGRGGGPRVVMRVWWIVMLADVLLETPALWLKVFYYYGPRPLDLFGFPLYWAPLDATLALLPGVLLYLFQRREWRVWHYLLVIALYPSNVMLVYLGAGWPIFSLQHAQVSIGWLWAVSPLTLLLCWVLARAVAAFSVLPSDAVESVRSAFRTEARRSPRDPQEATGG